MIQSVCVWNESKNKEIHNFLIGKWADLHTSCSQPLIIYVVNEAMGLAVSNLEWRHILEAVSNLDWRHIWKEMGANKHSG